MTTIAIPKTTRDAIKAAQAGFRRHQRHEYSAVETRCANRAVRKEAAQVFGKFAGSRVPTLRLAGNSLEYDGLKIGWNRAVDPPRPRRIDAQNACDQPAAVRFVVRAPQGQNLIQRKAERVDVAGCVETALKSLRGHIAQRAEQLAAVR